MSDYPPKAEERSTAVHDGPAAIIDELVEALDYCLNGLRYAEREMVNGARRDMVRSDIARAEAVLAKARGEQ